MERVRFPLGSSQGLAILIGIIYLSTLAVLFTLPLAYFFKILGLFFLVWRFCQIWTVHITRTAKEAIICIWQDPQGWWGYQTQQGRCKKGRLKGSSFKSQWVVILCIGLGTRKQYIVIPADALKAFQYRTLCARLNFFCEFLGD